MITNRTAISMSESTEYLSKKDDSGKEIIIFIKKFVSLDDKSAKELFNKLEKLNILKLKREDISKLVDLLPLTAEEINKIGFSSTLDEEEIKKIIEIIGEFK